MRSLPLLAALASFAAAKDFRTFAVLHFHGDGPLTIGRSDPIVNPGGVSSHMHHVHGGNAFSNSATGEKMLESTCSTADIAGDKSAYWMPSLFFHDVAQGTFEPVPLFYMNVYYFFEATNDDIKAFPVGLQIVSGNATQTEAPASGADQLDPSAGPIQPAQFTCPRSSFDPPSWPADSDGSVAGMQDPNNKGSGVGFPFAECDGYASPLRADLHFPSCYDPSKDLTDYRNNMAFPSDAGDGKQDCPEGWIHVPHLFYEMYWNTPQFADRWTPNQDSQPFVLSNGDAAGYSLHGDFLAAWDTDVLQTIIDTCDAGDAGMDQCPGVETVMEGDCSISNPSPEKIAGVLTALPGGNALFGWKYGTPAATYPTADGTATSTIAAAATTTKPVSETTTKVETTTSKAATTTSTAEAESATESTTEPTTTTTATTSMTSTITTTISESKTAKPTSMTTTTKPTTTKSTTTKPTTTTPTTTAKPTTTLTSTSTTTTDMTTTTTATRKPTTAHPTATHKPTTLITAYGKPSVPAVVGAVEKASSPTTASTSSTTALSVLTTAVTTALYGCHPHAHAHHHTHAETTTTITITSYSTSTSTSTLYRTTATATKRAHHAAHRRRL